MQLLTERRCLFKQPDNCVENVSNVILCFILHNFCQSNGENYFDNDGILDELTEMNAESGEEDLETMMLIPIEKKLEIP